jgi:hypothetical protein
MKLLLKMTAGKVFFKLFILSFLCRLISFAQEEIPVEIKRGHIYSQWTINESVKANVMLESGFSKIVFNEDFIKNNLGELNVTLIEASETARISFWGENRSYKVSYYVKDSLLINGRKQLVEAVVVNFSSTSHRHKDIIFPIADLNTRVELDIVNKYMKSIGRDTEVTDEFYRYPMKYDRFTKGLYFTTSLKVYDEFGNENKLTGDFLFDLGNPNAFFLNKNVPEVSQFILKTSDIHLKDTSMIQTTATKDREITVLMPERIQFANIDMQDHYIPSMKFASSANSDRYSGCIGNRFFENFVVIFDFENQTMHLKPTSEKVKFITPPNEKDTDN